MIGSDAKGKNIAFKTFREIRLPLLRGRVLGRARRILFLVRDEGWQISLEERVRKINQPRFPGRGHGHQHVPALQIVVDDGAPAEDARVHIRHRFGNALQEAMRPSRIRERDALAHQVIQRLCLDVFQKQPVRGGVIGQFAPDARVCHLSQHIGLVGDENLVPEMRRLLQQGGVWMPLKFHAGQLGHAGLDRQRLPFFYGPDFHGHSTLAGRAVAETIPIVLSHFSTN